MTYAYCAPGRNPSTAIAQTVPVTPGIALDSPSNGRIASAQAAGISVFQTIVTGSYRATLTATDASGVQSEPARASFRVRG